MTRLRTTLIAVPCFALAACLSPAEQTRARPVGKAEMEQIQTDEAVGPQLPSERLKLKAADLAKGKKLGGKWNQPGHHKVGAKGMDIELGGVKKHKVVELQFGNAHSYWVRFFNGDEKVGEIRSWPKTNVDRDRIIFRELYPPDAVWKKGYDRIRIVPVSDRRYSIGALILRDQKLHGKNKGGKGPGAKKPGQPGKPGATGPGRPAGAAAPGGARPAPAGAKPAAPAGAKPAAPAGAKPAAPAGAKPAG